MQPFAPDSKLVNACAPSPNCGLRAAGLRADMILLHYTGMRPEAREAWTSDPGGEALVWLCNPQAEVSSHYLIHLDGRIVQLVAEDARAWHAGRGRWNDCGDINSCSIGIEIVNTGHDGGLPEYPKAQIDAVIALCSDITRRRAIKAKRVLGHSDIAPARKADPGEHFPWQTLHRAGLGHWIAPEPLRDGPLLQHGDDSAAVAQWRAALNLYGYDAGEGTAFDEQLFFCTRAFQRHFRPARVDGAADYSTIETMRKLTAALPAG